MEEAIHGGVTPRVFTTRPDSPEDGRVFVWAKTRWYERIEASSGAVEFVHIADSEYDFHRWLAEAERISPSRLSEIDTDEELWDVVTQEFEGEVPLYPEAPETSDQAPFDEQERDVDEASGFHRKP
jgi:hypothetical protein